MLPSVLPAGVWVPSVTEPPAPGVWLVFSLSPSASVVLVWDVSPSVVFSGDWLGCCMLSEVLPLVVEFSFG